MWKLFFYALYFIKLIIVYNHNLKLKVTFLTFVFFNDVDSFSIDLIEISYNGFYSTRGIWEFYKLQDTEKTNIRFFHDGQKNCLLKKKIYILMRCNN